MNIVLAANASWEAAEQQMLRGAECWSRLPEHQDKPSAWTRCRITANGTHQSWSFGGWCVDYAEWSALYWRLDSAVLHPCT